MSQSSPAASSRKPRKYWAFISYRHADNKDEGRQWATWMHQALETYDIPSDLVGTENKRKDRIPERIYPIFRDEEELAADADLASSIEAALDNSQYLVVICSPRAVASTYVEAEIVHFKRTKAERMVTMIIDGKPEVVEDDPDQPGDKQACFPKPLRFKITPDGKVSNEREVKEPIAADFRLNNTSSNPGQGWTNPEAYRQALIESGEDPARIKQLVATYQKQLEDNKLQVIAGILGVEKGELTRRDKAYQLKLAKKRARRLLRTLTVVGVLFLLAVAAGIFAMVQRATAIRERDESEARRLATVSKSNAAELTDVAILLALESLRVTETDEGWGALFTALSRPVFARSPLTGHQGKVSQVSFSPDGKLIASAGDDGTLRLWDVASGREIHQFTEHRHPDHPEIVIEVKAVTFSPDGRFMASGDSFGDIMLWEVEPRTQLGDTLTGHTNAIKTLAFGADGSSLVSAGLDDQGKGDVRVWKVGATGAQAGATLTGHAGEVRSVRFLGATKLASAGLGGTVRLWDSTTGAETGQAIPPQNGWGGALHIGARGKILAVADLDWSIQLWNLETGERVGKPMTGHDGEVFAAAFSTDGTRMATASLDRSVRIWKLDLESGEHRQIGEPLTGHKGEVSSVTFSPNDSWLATASLDGTVRLWDVSSGPAIGGLLTDGESLPLVALSHDGTRIASANSLGVVRLWDRATRSMIFEHQAHRSATRVALSSDGSRLASGGFDGSIQLWSVDTIGPRLLDPPTRHKNRISALAFSPGKGAKLASACGDGVVRLWDVEPAAGVSTTGHAGAVSGLAFSPDGKRLVSAGFDGTLRLWDSELAPVGGTLSGHKGVVWDAVFKSDGSELTSVGNDGTVRRWDVASAKQIGDPLIRGPNQWAGPAAFSPRGARLVTATSDGTLRLWDLASGRAIGVPLAGHGSELTGMAFSGDAALLVSASSDGTLRLWPGRNRWIGIACKSVGRNLTLAEWKEFVDSESPYQRQCARSPSGFGALESPDPQYSIQFKKQE